MVGKTGKMTNTINLLKMWLIYLLKSKIGGYMIQEKIKIPVWVALEADVLVCKNLSSTEKVLYGIIAALSNNSQKKCFATNKYFSKILDITPRDVQYCLSELKRLKFIEIEVENNKRSITTVVNSFLEYRQNKLRTNHQEYLEVLEYDWLNDEIK